MPKRVKLKNPDLAYFSPQDGIVVQGNAVVEFPDLPTGGTHPDVLVKIAAGALIETDEKPHPNTYRVPLPESPSATPRWAITQPAHLEIIQALPTEMMTTDTAAPAPAEGPVSIADVQAENAALRARVSELEGQVSAQTAAGTTTDPAALQDTVAQHEQALEAAKEQTKAAKEALTQANKDLKGADEAGKEAAQARVDEAKLAVAEAQDLEEHLGDKLKEAQAALRAAQGTGDSK